MVHLAKLFETMPPVLLRVRNFLCGVCCYWEPYSEWPMLPPEAMVMSGSMLPLRVMCGPMVLLWLWSVLMSMAHVGCLWSVLQTQVVSAGEYLRCHLEAVLVSMVWAGLWSYCGQGLFLWSVLSPEVT